jgi:hypothetical protein
MEAFVLIALIGLCVGGVIICNTPPSPPPGPPPCHHTMDINTLHCQTCRVFAPYGRDEYGNILLESWPMAKDFEGTE